MKNIKTLAVVAGLGLTVSAFAIVHKRHGAAWPHHVMGHRSDASSAVEHLGEAFPKFAAFDTDKDGKFDTVEQEALAKAMSDGTLQLPAHSPPKARELSADMLRTHIADMYARLAAYDANRDGSLNAAEQTAIKKAIESGDLICPFGGPDETTRVHH